jgi:hypothetical protein
MWIPPEWLPPKQAAGASGGVDVGGAGDVGCAAAGIGVGCGYDVPTSAADAAGISTATTSTTSTTTTSTTSTTTTTTTTANDNANGSGTTPTYTNDGGDNPDDKRSCRYVDGALFIGVLDDSLREADNHGTV